MGCVGTDSTGQAKKPVSPFEIADGGPGGGSNSNPSISIYVNVSNNFDGPLANATVMLAKSGGGFSQSKQTNSAGRAVFSGIVDAGTYIVTGIDLNGYVFPLDQNRSIQITSTDISARAAKEINVSMNRILNIQGQVYDSTTYQFISNATTKLYYHSPGSPSGYFNLILSSQTNSQGNFDFGLWQEGLYKIETSKDGYQTDSNTFLHPTLASHSYLPILLTPADTNAGTATTITLKNNSGYPYDPNNTTGQYDWKVFFSQSTYDILSIEIVNYEQTWTNAAVSPNGPLYVPSQALTTQGTTGNDTATFLYNTPAGTPGKDFFSLKFQGFETDEPVTQTKFEANKLTYRDANDRLHQIPYYITLNKSTSGLSFSFDGVTIYTKSNYYYSPDQNASDGNFSISKSFNIPSEETWYQFTDLAVSSSTVMLPGQDDVQYKYKAFADNYGATGQLYLILDSQIFDGRYDADIKFFGTDTTENGSIDRTYYWPDLPGFGGLADNSFFIAKFGVETGGSYTLAAESNPDFDTTVYIDTNSNLLPVFPNPFLSTYSAAVEFSEGDISFKMDRAAVTTNQPGKAYNDFGSKFVINPNQTFEITVPDKARKIVLQVTGPGGSKILKSDANTSGTEFDTYNFSSKQPYSPEFLISMTKDSLPGLVNEQTTLKVNGIEYMVNYKEKMINTTTLDALFDSTGDKNAADLEGQIDKLDMGYTLVISPFPNGRGIPRANYQDDANNTIIIPFFGEHWKVLSTNYVNQTITLEKV